MKRHKINYISNLPLKEVSGGGLGINKNTYEQLSKQFDLVYVGPISPSVILHEKIPSSILRKLGFRSNYHFFSENRLEAISTQAKDSVQHDAVADFFHGITSWIKYRSQRPYFAYTDACFATYVRIFNNKEDFREKDLERIYDQESSFLDNASCVFFRSKWALEETKMYYGLKGENFKAVQFGGGVDIPEKDKYRGGKNIVFISKEFGPKGGYTVLEAFMKIQKLYPELKLVVIGDAPRRKEVHQSVTFTGFLDKSNPSQVKIFNSYLENAFVLLHPTLKDTNTLVITEAGSFGCPAISSKLFAIPEFIQEKETGCLLNNPRNVDEIINQIKFLMNNPKLYKKMRVNVKRKVLETYNWDTVGRTISAEINRALS